MTRVAPLAGSVDRNAVDNLLFFARQHSPAVQQVQKFPHRAVQRLLPAHAHGMAEIDEEGGRQPDFLTGCAASSAFFTGFASTSCRNELFMAS